MALKEKLSADMKVAMKAREADRLGAIRLVIAELQKEEIAKAKALDEAEEIAVLARAAKQRRESIEAFEKCGRQEMADKEKVELALIESYLPAQLTPDQVRDLAKEIIAEVGAAARSDAGKVMGKLMPKIKGRFPGKDVKPIVDELLP